MKRQVFDDHSRLVAICEQLADDLIPFVFAIEKGDLVVYTEEEIKV